jgi:hypothetical protein
MDEKSRIDYICDFFQKIYKAPHPNDTLRDNCIEEFLGPEVCANSPQIKTECG